MRVLSFNLRNANAKDGPNAWDARTEAVADVWRAIDADLAGIQEGYLRQVRFLEERFPGYLRLGVGRDGGENGEHSAIFVRRDRFRVLAHGDFWLSDTPEVPASKHWGNNCVRMATWAHLRDHEGGELLYLNTHLDHEAPQARVKGAELICSFLAERSGDRPVVVTGDFNERPEGETVRTFLERGYTDALAAVKADGGTFHGFSERVRGRIDYVMCRGWRVTGGRVVTEQYQGRYTSDHYPIYAELARS